MDARTGEGRNDGARQEAVGVSVADGGDEVKAENDVAVDSTETTFSAPSSDTAESMPRSFDDERQ